MQNQRAIKWAFWGLLVVCLVQALYIFMSSPFRPDPSKVVSATNVSGGGAVYELLYDTGGATVADTYRYFLMEVQPSDEAVLEKSKKMEPFLVTKSGNAVRGVTGDKVKLKTDNTIYKFVNISIFKLNGEIQIVRFELDATVP